MPSWFNWNRAEMARPEMRFTPAGPFFSEIDEAALDEIFTQLKIFIAQHAG